MIRQSPVDIMLIIDPSKWPNLATKTFPDSCIFEHMRSRIMAKSMPTMFPMKSTCNMHQVKSERYAGDYLFMAILSENLTWA